MLCIKVNPSVSAGAVVSQLHTQIQLAGDHVSGGAGLEPLSKREVIVVEQLVAKVGLLISHTSSLSR